MDSTPGNLEPVISIKTKMIDAATRKANNTAAKGLPRVFPNSPFEEDINGRQLPTAAVNSIKNK